MSCTITPYNQLTGTKQIGGTWKLISSPSGNPMSVSVNGGVNTSYSPGSTIPGDDTMTLGFNGTAPGIYVIQYTVGVDPCTASALVTIEVAPSAKAGVTKSITYCNSDQATYNLFQLLQNYDGLGNIPPGSTIVPVDTTGSWSGSGTQSNAYNAGNATTPTDDTFKPSLVSFQGTGSTQVFVFTYTVTTPGAPQNCDNCNDTATLTISVTLQPNAGTSANVTVCNAL